MTARLGPKGQVVIPKPMRDALGVEPGDEVDFALDEGAVRVIPVQDASPLKGRFRGLRLTAELMVERETERSSGR